eukprot:7655255-Pyramimonas_sp.AAC.1
MRSPAQSHGPISFDLRRWSSQVVLIKCDHVMLLALLVLYELLGGLIVLRAVGHENFDNVPEFVVQFALLGAVDDWER